MRETIVEILRQSIDRAEATGFALLKRIPSSDRYHHLDYYFEIDAAEREALKNAHAIRAAAWFGFPMREESDGVAFATLQRQAKRFAWSGNWRYAGVRELRMMRNALKADPDHSFVRNTPKEALEKIATVETAKAAELRKVAKIAFAQFLGAKPSGRLGLWEYPGKLNGEDVIVRVDFGGMVSQLRYEVILPRLAHERGSRPASYEQLHGFGSGEWNQIEENREDEAFAVMVELVRETVDLSMKVYEEMRKRG